MTRLLALVAVVFAALARSARANDAQTAAAAQALNQAGAPTGAAPAAAGGNQNGIGGSFERQLSTPQIQKTTGGARKRATVKKGARVKTNASKYKSRELSENSEHLYRFDENGDPVNPAPQKKSAAKPAKKTSSASDADAF